MSTVNTNPDPHKMFNLMVVGAVGVGKSALILRVIRNCFVEEFDPTIEDSYRLNIEVDGVFIPSEVIDTAESQPWCEGTLESYARKTDGVLLVYSISNSASFAEVDQFRELILRIKNADSWPMVLVGAKCDLEADRAVSVKEAREYANCYNMSHIEVSAKLGTNTQQPFVQLIREMKKFQEERSKPKPQAQASWCNIM
jgi:GTPase KRas protein